MGTMDDFSDEQKHYLQGFMSGALTARTAQGLPGLAPGGAKPAGSAPDAQAPAGLAGPEAAHFEAQARTLAAGKKLVAEEEAKRKHNPYDLWDLVTSYAAEGRVPKGIEVFLWKFQGMFYVAPAQDSFMCRLRMPNGVLNTFQFRGIARLARDFGGGYSHATTRANLQIREIGPKDTVNVLTGLYDLGLTAKGSGADNIRNVTGDATAGVSAQELIDTRPLARAMHHYILNHREMYGLPRKFNIAFDGGGPIATLEDTNDIGFTACRVPEGKSVPAGVYFRMGLGGITGHKDLAQDSGWLLRPEECVPAAAAVLKIYIAEGDRSSRQKARMKYVLDRWGHAKYLEEVEKLLAFKPLRLPLAECEPRPPVDRLAHIGVHPQKQTGRYYAGIALPLGRMNVEQMEGLADLADRFGSGTLRLTVWQNLLISDIAAEHLDAVRAGVAALGLALDVDPVRAGLVACTGNKGCRFAASDTKGHAAAIATHLDGRVVMDQPVNIHLTGCHHSCAQHYIGDVGLIGAKVERGEDEEVEGYHLFVGGGFGADGGIGRELYRSIAADDLPAVVERMLAAYLAHRAAPDETFQTFTRRHSEAELKALFGDAGAAG